MASVIGAVLVALKTTGVAAFIQGAAAAAPSTGIGVDCAFPGNNTLHNCIAVVVGGFGNGKDTVVVTDDQGNVYNEIDFEIQDLTHGRCGVFVALDCAAGANTVHATISTGVPDLDIVIAEYSNVALTAAVDANVARGSDTSGVTLPALTTTAANDLLVLGCYDSEDNTTVFTVSPGSGWAQRGQSSNPDAECASLLDNIGVAIGTYNYDINGGGPVNPPVVSGVPPDTEITLPYSFTFTVTDGVGPFTWAITVGALPGGITLNPATGELSGSALFPGNFPFTIQVTDSALVTGDLPTNIHVDDRPSVNVKIEQGGVGFFVYLANGIPAYIDIEVKGGTPPYTITGFNLPDGMQVSAVPEFIETGSPFRHIYKLYGTPNQTLGIFPVNSADGPSIIVTDAVGVQGAHVFLQYDYDPSFYFLPSQGINGPGPDTFGSTQSIAVIPPATKGVAYSFQIDKSWCDAIFSTVFTGPDPAGYVFSNLHWPGTGGDPGGLMLSADGILSGTPGAATFDIAIPPGLLPYFPRFTITGITSGHSEPELLLLLHIYGVLVQCSPGGAGIPDGAVGIPYSNQFPASGGTAPYTWALVDGAFPTGLTLDGATGILSGTPTTAGTYSFTVQVTDDVGATNTTTCSMLIVESASVACSITIIALTVSCNNPPVGTVGLAYSHAFGVSGGTAPYTWTLVTGPMPPGLSMASTGVVSGTPTTAGTYPLTLHVQDAIGATGNLNCSITIIQPTPPTVGGRFLLQKVVVGLKQARLPVRGSSS